jgi:hypothetical protein
MNTSRSGDFDALREGGPIEPHHVLVIEPPDMRTYLGLGNGGDLVHHQAAGGTQAVALVRLHDKAEQRRVGRKRVRINADATSRRLLVACRLGH